MDRRFPLYTEEAECQDCYKCLRHCPVKAIKIEAGRASIVPELCIVCGRCVAACPSKAKQVRNDTDRVRQLLGQDRPVYVSLAPSWISEFRGIETGRLIAGLKRLGFAGVGETALGAQQVSAAVAGYLGRGAPRLSLSTACPAAVDFVRSYLPELAPCLTPFMSPMLAHCALLRRAFGEDIGIVFIGPCVAKKGEADKHPHLLDAALTFQDLRVWLDEACLDLAALSAGPEDGFVPEAAREGAIYPVEGGMSDTVRMHKDLENVRFVTLTSIHTIDRALRGLDVEDLSSPVFVELLACEGGCVRGPCITGERPWLVDQLDVLARVNLPDRPTLRSGPSINIAEVAEPSPVDFLEYTEECIAGALRLVGKFQPEDELNCGGCGYETCRAMAEALLEGLAEPSMCIHFLRKRALRKANALLRCIPAGVVIVDARMKIIECNEPFAQLFGEDVMLAFEARPGMEGASLEKIVPFAGLFRTALSTGKDTINDALRLDERVFSISIFAIEPGQVIGGIIFDVTGAKLHRDRIAQQAREILRKNLETVQEIACRLGENMADTEILLRSLAEGFSSDSRQSAENTLKQLSSPPTGRRRP